MFLICWRNNFCVHIPRGNSYLLKYSRSNFNIYTSLNCVTHICNMVYTICTVQCTISTLNIISGLKPGWGRGTNSSPVFHAHLYSLNVRLGSAGWSKSSHTPLPLLDINYHPVFHYVWKGGNRAWGTDRIYCSYGVIGDTIGHNQYIVCGHWSDTHCIGAIDFVDMESLHHWLYRQRVTAALTL